MEAPEPRGRRVVFSYVGRGIYAAAFIAFNFIAFYLIPSIFLGSLGRFTPDVEATVTGSFLAISGLTVVRIVLKDHILGAASAAALGLIEAIYIYIVTQEGVLDASLYGLHLTVDFKPLVYLMMTPPLLGVTKQLYSIVHKSVGEPTTFTVE